jgi:hypothetical protein
MSELVDEYNKATHDMGINAVRKFKDLKTGQSRLLSVIKSEEVDLPPLEKTEKKGNVVPFKKGGKKEAKKEKANGRSSSAREKKLFPAVNENPFKRGWGMDTFAKIVKKPGKTFAQYVEEGGRVPAIAHAIKQGWLRAE